MPDRDVHQAAPARKDPQARSYDVITIGDMCVDLIIAGNDVAPRFGQVEKLVDDYVIELGGSCCIFACQAAKLGLHVGILGRVGDDIFARLILDRLIGAGVDVSRVTVDPALKTGFGRSALPG
jgi:sugar/nucleoside kinase (ribokinase family)